MTKEEMIAMKERSEKIQESEETLNALFGQKVLVKHENDILYYGIADSTTVRKLDDWPDEIDILPANDVEFTLKDMLKNLSGKNVKLGACDGVGFIYCGEVKPGLIPWLDKKSGQMYEAMNIQLDKIRASIHNFDKEYFPRYLERCRITWCKAHRTMDGFDESISLEEYKKRAMDNLKAQETRLANKIRRFNKLTNCLIEEMCTSISPDEEGALIILFEGTIMSSGSFWTIEECQRDGYLNWDIDVMANRRFN